MTHEPHNGHDGDQRHGPEIQALEARLAALRPREDRLNRERLMFLAGQASVTREGKPIDHGFTRWGKPAMLVAAGAAAAWLIMSSVSLDSTRHTTTGGNNDLAESPNLASNSDAREGATQIEGRLYAVMPVDAYEALVSPEEHVSSYGEVFRTHDPAPIGPRRPLMIRSFDDVMGPG
jgi:hypothetical protein